MDGGAGWTAGGSAAGKLVDTTARRTACRFGFAKYLRA
jgi:hypothetical protein